MTGTDVSPERAGEIGRVCERVTRWAAGRADVVGLLLVGSCARGEARMDSDVDLVLLTTDRARYADGSALGAGLGLGEPVRTRSWGPITEWRYADGSGLEIELGVGSPAWAATDPVDAGTRRVVSGGARALYDPEGILAALIGQCGGVRRGD
ncbi:nucleotidyltransferase domain-containing protein [Streptomyces sp. bgisy153]|uniref:nucleotidyltransferase domain-containing protein n=1 Tax=Streptomyces sp. bgisy153 TaxID=3413793 RepID=UPI003D75EC72